MTATTRSRRTLQWVVAFLGTALFGWVITTSTPAHEPWWFLLYWILMPAAFGVAISVVLMLARRGGSRPVRSSRDPFAKDTSTDVINMARIRVAGFGGLGMVAVAGVMAYTFPRIGQSLLIGAAGGLVMAGLIIVFRTRRGPLASGHDGPDRVSLRSR